MVAKQGKKKTSTGLFIVVFLIVAGLTIINNVIHKDLTTLTVPDNPGVSGMETINQTLVTTFQNGHIVSWDWDTFEQTGDFRAASDRTCVLNAQHLAAVNTSGDKVLTVYSLPSGQKQQDLSVGWSDQDVWPRISPDRKVLALIRKNPPNKQDKVLYEFLTVDIEKKLLSPPATLSIQQDIEKFVDYAVDNHHIMYAVGSRDKIGRIAAIDLNRGTKIWDNVFEGTKEFCSVMASPDNPVLYAGNRDGILYKLDAKTGEITRKIQLLEPGETRPITNDYSVLNLAFSPDGRYYVATINPPAYVLDAKSDTVIHKFSPADKLVSRIAFSPDNRFIATSDIRASYPIKIWPLPKEK